jgi:hypothetical protein
LQLPTWKDLIDIADDRIGLVQWESVMLEGRDFAERVPLQMAGLSSLTSQEVNRL